MAGFWRLAIPLVDRWTPRFPCDGGRLPELQFLMVWVKPGESVAVQVGELSVVWKSKWARFSSGFRNSSAWDSPILRGPS